MSGNGHRDDHDHGHGAGDHGGESHDHSGHDHAHAPADFGAAFAIGIALNVGFVAIEAAYGLIAGSVALLSDAGHNLGDVLGLSAAWLASRLVQRAPSARFTYGLRGSSILAALFNAVFLLLTVGAISWEAILRLAHPAPVAGNVVMVVAAIGIVVNGVTAWLFASGQKDDINLRGAFLHMASDALVSAGVVASGFVILATGWLWLDPLTSLAVNVVIVWGTWDSCAIPSACRWPPFPRASIRRSCARSSRRGRASRRCTTCTSGRSAQPRPPSPATSSCPPATRATPSCMTLRPSSPAGSASATRPCRSKPTPSSPARSRRTRWSKACADDPFAC